MALESQKVDKWDRTRDYFTALVAAAYLSTEGNPVDPERLLLHKYKDRSPDVNITHNPDFGAVWEGPRLDPEKYRES